MVTDKIAIFISNELGLTLGEDIFLHMLPSDSSEGIAVHFTRDLGDDGAASESEISIFILYRNWSEVKSKLESLKAAFIEKLGLITTEWAITSPVRINNHGLDEYERFISSINITVKY